MVFIFGYDLPLIEFFAAITVLVLLLTIGIAYILRTLVKLNHKVDRILGEEKVFHRELAETKKEEDIQLSLMKKLVIGMSDLAKMNKSENKKLDNIKKSAIRKIKTAKGGKEAAHFNDIVKIVENLQGISTKESAQLRLIHKIAKEFRKKQGGKKLYGKLKGLFGKNKK